MNREQQGRRTNEATKRPSNNNDKWIVGLRVAHWIAINTVPKNVNRTWKMRDINIPKEVWNPLVRESLGRLILYYHLISSIRDRRMSKLPEVFWGSIPKCRCGMDWRAFAESEKERDRRPRPEISILYRYNDERVDTGGWLKEKTHCKANRQPIHPLYNTLQFIAELSFCSYDDVLQKIRIQAMIRFLSSPLRDFVLEKRYIKCEYNIADSSECCCSSLNSTLLKICSTISRFSVSASDIGRLPT